MEELFKKSWFSEDRDAITIDASYDSENRIENFLDVSESKQRFNRIDAASFAKVNFVPRHVMISIRSLFFQKIPMSFISSHL